MHDAQVHVEVPTVRTLLAEQFPQWGDLPVTHVEGAGTVNALFRVGDGLAARFPLVVNDPDASLAAQRLEADRAHEFAGASDVPCPLPVAIGRAGAGYPGPWSLTTWIDGHPASPHSVEGSTVFANELAELILRLRAAPTSERAFTGTGRGGDLRTHDEWMATCLTNSEGLLDVPALRSAWARLRRLPRLDGDAMTHGDLIPANLLVRDGHLAGVVDVGGFAPADPALDLVAAWHLFEEPARGELRAALRRGIHESEAVEELRWARGAAWAFEQALGLVWYYRVSNPAMSELGISSLQRIMEADVLARP
ncbi:phosphotransferase [Humibacter ginsenosidimutans]|uniref:Phosphotransferase n=1 Tax=Humibacter ginsenosidimutans TaxID=2599293 RepID=A0A5B8M4A5_9MICO|nr:phosphotransferase [Humibacter ginsenosidimutans]QDZ14615.1 phosphotransferase [Humibacter ginsenosidimutans]